MSDKIKLAEGQRSAEYTVLGNSFEELGRNLDSFYADVDYATADAGGLEVHVDINHVRCHQRAEPLTTSIGHSAIVTLYSRRYA